MNGFTDMHTHILPGVDDGAQDLSQSLRMLRKAWDNGTTAVVLTPHYRGKFKQHTPDMLKENLAWLQEMVASELPDMQLYLGQEIAYENEAPEAMYQGKALCINGSQYVLLEFQTNSLCSQITNGVTETIRNGFVPIIAHVERCNAVRKDPDFPDELLHMGALLQLNADSILGKNGFEIKRFCHKLLKNRKVHFVASDAHDILHRPPVLRECFLRVHKKYGEEYAVLLFSGNAQAVIADRVVE